MFMQPWVGQSYADSGPWLETIRGYIKMNFFQCPFPLKLAYRGIHIDVENLI